MKIVFLGTGTSQGVPIIGSNRAVAHSTDPHDKRLRTSVALITDDKKIVLIDCGPDFRYQMLRNGLSDISGIIFTHAHADHTAGLDDVRPICYFYHHDIDLYAKEDVMDALKQRFAYVFEKGEKRYPGAPWVVEHVIEDAPFSVAGLQITPVSADHGWIDVTGYRIGSFAYMTDVKHLPEASYQRLKGVDTLVINCLRLENPHPTHMILSEAMQVITRLHPRRTYFTHISESMGFSAEAEKELPKGVYLAYDTLEIEV